jgi:hypothetical protein
LLNIQNLENADKQQAVYMARTINSISIDSISIDSISIQHGPLYAPDEKIYEQDEVCWRVAQSKEPFDLHVLIDDFSNWYDRAIDQRGCLLTTNISPDLPRFFEGNLLMLGFLLWDLASYSQVYLGSGGVKLAVHSEPFSGNWCSIYFSLKIPGLGIPLEKEKMLFLPSDSNWKKEVGSHASSNLYYAGIIAGLLGGIVRVRNNIGFGVEYIAEIRLLNRPD